MPNSLDISKQNGDHLRKKKRRRKRPNEGMADFSSTYELTNEQLGEGAWSRVSTCIHRRTKKAYAVKVSPWLYSIICTLFISLFIHWSSSIDLISYGILVM